MFAAIRYEMISLLLLPTRGHKPRIPVGSRTARTCAAFAFQATT